MNVWEQTILISGRQKKTVVKMAVVSMRETVPAVDSRPRSHGRQGGR